MEKYQIDFIAALLGISVAVLFIPAAVFCIRGLIGKLYHRPSGDPGISRMLVFSACLICSVWCLRYAVGYYELNSAAGDALTLTWWEEVFNSMGHALQTFSMDEDYTAYILNGKAMLTELFGEVSILPVLYGLYASVLNFVAPVAGGAIIFEILASVFPKIKLHILNYVFWREKYYFSELNAASLALAKSIAGIKSHPLTKPVIIFTDAYSDADDERKSEILLGAKNIGAICVKDDLSHVRKNKRGMRRFFLVDEDGAGNLQTLVDLSSPDNSEYLRKSEIYFFTTDDAYIQVERRVSDRLKVDFKFTDEELPVFVPVQSYRNLITNLLVDVPLYEPLIGKSAKEDGSRDLTVTILGTGFIGTEMFLSVYWFGQILGCNLKINILSQESEGQFWNRIDYVNPEIRHTTIEGDPILRINRKGDMSDVYCEVKYLQCDVKSSEFISCLTDDCNNILDTDYFLVSLGSDETNISVADTVQKYIGQHHIRTACDNKVVISYVVYDPELSEVLNRKKFFSYTDGKADIYMQAIGSLDEVYSVKNVFLSDHESVADEAHNAYVTVHAREERAKIHKKRMNDDYKHWASLARAMHIKYKAYSMGMVNKSLFDFPDAPEEYREEVMRARSEYRRVASGEIADFTSPEHEAQHLQLLHDMAWLEHRRWNAFTRVKGFQYTGDYDAYAVEGNIGSYKHMELKLHPCLVECDKKGIRAVISAKGVVDESTLLKCTDDSDFDLLDDLSYDLNKKKYNDYDFKLFDYPIFSV